MSISQPNEFLLLLDRDGDPADLCCIKDDVIQACLRELDRNHPDDSPHTAWLWSGGEWSRWE